MKDERCGMLWSVQTSTFRHLRSALVAGGASLVANHIFILGVSFARRVLDDKWSLWVRHWINTEIFLCNHHTGVVPGAVPALHAIYLIQFFADH